METFRDRSDKKKEQMNLNIEFKKRPLTSRIAEEEIMKTGKENLNKINLQTPTSESGTKTKQPKRQGSDKTQIYLSPNS
jgi:hypothetical protein